jgi:2-C-methyl-D-erythritol 4-phosphate cytidylyltransferase
MPRFAVILPAAGKSSRFRDKESRFRDKEKKVFASLDGRAVWLRSAELFVNRDDVAQCLVVVAAEDREKFTSRYGAHLGLLGVQVVTGGAERFDSVANALAVVRDDCDCVAIHDAARPCLTAELIDTVFGAAARTGAALLAVPVSDTLKRSDDQGRVEATLPRRGLWLAQTPQVFRRDWLADAYARRASLGRDVTDDAQLVEAAGHPVYLVTGSTGNIKITTREDLALAAAVLKSRPPPKVARPIHPFEDEAKW